MLFRSKNAIAVIYKRIFNDVDSLTQSAPQHVTLNLPKLKKIDNETKPTITLPNLKKIDA